MLDSTADSVIEQGQSLADSFLGGDPSKWPADWLDQLVQVQKLAAMGTMAAMLAHEFNNILTRAINYAEHALHYPEDRELTRTSLGKILENCGRAGEICRSIFDFAGTSDGRRRPVALAKLVADAINCLGRDPAKDNIAIRCRVSPELTVQADGTLLQQVLYNLVLNARQAILARDRRGGRITLSADRAADGRVEVRVSDTGCGIAPDDLPKIWQPFFSTKRSNDKAEKKGIGLGLAICRSIITDHGGTIDAESCPGQGTTFTIRLPGN
jgi:two-component system NtrC family sensor kinase